MYLNIFFNLAQIIYFDDPLLKTLNYLDALCQMDNCQKMHFFKGLPQILIKFPKVSFFNFFPVSHFFFIFLPKNSL